MARLAQGGCVGDQVSQSPIPVTLTKNIVSEISLVERVLQAFPSCGAKAAIVQIVAPYPTISTTASRSLPEAPFLEALSVNGH